jgi:lipoate-protein ligase B
MRPISYTKLATKVKPIINSVEVHRGGVHGQTLQLRASIYNIQVAFGIVVRRGESNHGLAIYIKKTLS